MKVAKQVGRFEVETWTDGWPLWITIKDRESGVELSGLLPEDATDLMYALERLQAKIAPIITKASQL